MLALFTIWTRMGVSSPSSARRPCRERERPGWWGASRRPHGRHPGLPPGALGPPAAAALGRLLLTPSKQLLHGGPRPPGWAAPNTRQRNAAMHAAGSWPQTAHWQWRKRRKRKRHLCKGRCCHLDSAFVRSVDLEVVAVGAVQAQEATAGKASIVPWVENSSVPTQRACLGWRQLRAAPTLPQGGCWAQGPILAPLSPSAKRRVPRQLPPLLWAVSCRTEPSDSRI